LLTVAAIAALGASTASAAPRTASQAAVSPTYLWGVSCPDASHCVAVGQHTKPLGQPVTAIERLRNGTWSAVPSPEPPGATSAALNGVSCASTRACLAVGSFTRASGTVAPFTERWNGTRWSLLPVVNPPDSSNTALSGVWCSAAANCWAVGNYLGDALAEHWDGTAWAVYLPFAGNTHLLSVTCPDSGDCWATGSAKAGTVTAHWNGTDWSAVTTPTSGSANTALNSVSCASTEACVAVGSGQAGPLAQRWNGSSWTQSTVKSPPPAGLFGASCTSGSSCLAVGSRATGPTSEVTLAATFIRRGWFPQTTPNPAHWLISALQGIACRTAADCWAVGGSGSHGEPGRDRSIVEHWNGTKWSLVG
jgi:hypothetical protein